jgi:hypothetical protein
MRRSSKPKTKQNVLLDKGTVSYNRNSVSEPRRTMSYGVLARLICVLSMVCVSTGAATVTVRVSEAHTGNLAKVLVIVRSLEADRSEVLRALTGPDGLVPAVDVPPGLYEAIATYPYSRHTTIAKDFVIGEKPVMVELKLTHLSDQRVNLNSIDWQISVTNGQGRPVGNAWVTGRDDEASDVSVTRTDSKGRATVSIPMTGAVITVLYDGFSYTEGVYVESGITNCEHECALRAAAKLKTHSRTLIFTVR